MVPLRRKRDISDFLGDAWAAELWRVIAIKGLNADDFQVDASELRGYAWKLTYRPTGQALYASASLVDISDRAYVLKTQLDGNRAGFGPVDSANYHSIAKDWVTKLKDDKPHQQPRDSGPKPEQPTAGRAAGNTPFTPAESAEIAKQLRAIRQSVRMNYQLSADQLSAIDQRMQEAEDASRRLGRKDWKSVFYGGVFSMIINDAIPPDVAQHIFTGVLHGISHLLGVGVPPGPWLLGQ